MSALLALCGLNISFNWTVLSNYLIHPFGVVGGISQPYLVTLRTRAVKVLNTVLCFIHALILDRCYTPHAIGFFFTFQVFTEFSNK